MHKARGLGLLLAGWVLWMAGAAQAAEIPSGIQEYFVLGNEENMYRSFEAVAAAEGKPLNPATRGMESVITLAASLDRQVIVYDHWEDGFDDDPINQPGPTTQRFELRRGEPLTLQSTEETAAWVPIGPRGTAIRYDGGDRILSIGGPVSAVHLMWPLKTIEIGDSWELRPVKALETALYYTIPVGVDSYTETGGDAGSYAAFKYVFIEVQALEDNTQITVGNGQDPDAIIVLDRGESYSSMGYINGQAAAGTQRTIYEGSTIVANNPVQLGMHTYGSGAYQSRFYNSVPDSIYGTDYVTQTRGTSAAPTQLYLFNPWGRPIEVTAYDAMSLGGTEFQIPPGKSVAYSDVVGHYLPQGSGARLMSDEPFYALAAYDTDRDFDWGYTLVPSYYLGTEMPVPYAPGNRAGSNNNAIWVSAIQQETKVRFDLNGDGIWDLVDMTRDGSADPADGPSGDPYYLVDVLHPIMAFDHADQDMTGARVVADKPISLAYGQYDDNSNERSGSPDWGYTLLPVIRPWLDVVYSLRLDADTRSVPSAGGDIHTVFTATAHAGDIGSPGLEIELPPGVSVAPGSATLHLPGGVTHEVNPVIDGAIISIDVSQYLPVLLHDDSWQVELALRVDGSLPRGEFSVRAVATGLWHGVELRPESSMRLSKGALHLAKYSNATTSVPGSTVRWYLVLTNIDPSPVTDAVIEDMVPPDVRFVEGSCGSCEYDVIARTLRWNVGAVLPGEMVSVSFDTIVKNGIDSTVVSNEGLAWDNAGNSARSNVVEISIAAPRLWLEKSVSVANVHSGDIVRYTLRFGNAGSATAHGLSLRDYLPSGISYVPGSMVFAGNGGAVPLADGSNDDGGEIEGEYVGAERLLKLSFQELKPGETFSLQFDAQVDFGLPDGTRIINAATLWAGNSILRRARGAVIEIGNGDADCDGLTDAEELNMGTDPYDPDTDGDGLPDGLELGKTAANTNSSCALFAEDSDPASTTNPVSNDTDGDGLADGSEDANLNGRVDAGETDPTRVDSDGDGLSDPDELARGTDPLNPDTDSDGLQDGNEVQRGTNPLLADTDGDGLNDGAEVNQYGTDPLNPDTDADGLNDYLEAVLGSYGNGKTDPLNADTDGDGLADGVEDANANGAVDAGETDPTLADTDGDGIPDGEDPYPTNPDGDGDGLNDAEEGELGTDPTNPDTDGDGLSDGDEIANGTDPLNPDTDGDGLLDGEEVYVYGTDPLNPDTDGDGLLDGAEVHTWGTNPLASDSDGDGLGDYLEVIVGSYGNGKTDPLNADTDGDGLSDGAEDADANGSRDAGETDPTMADTDGDGIPDGEDPYPTNPDGDGDGLTDGEEVDLGTDPENPDTDGDGLSDGDEIVNGTDPLNPDTDLDGLLDGIEVNSNYGGGRKTDPLNPDSDGDGLWDGLEDASLDGRRDPGETDPTDADTDDDGLSDGHEVTMRYEGNLFTNPLNPDTDGDGLRDGEEDANADGIIGAAETHPVKADTDGDRLSDGLELTSCYTDCRKTDPRNIDTDGDGLFDSTEDRNRNGRLDAGETDPTLADTDGDGIPDGEDGNPLQSDHTGTIGIDTDRGGVADDLERDAGTDPFDGDDDYLAAERVRVQGGGGCNTAGADAGSVIPVLGALGLLLLRRRRGVAALAAAAVLVTTAGAARAQDAKVDPQTFHPTPDGQGLTVLEGAASLEAGTPSAAAYFDYAHDPLVAEGVSGTEYDVVGRIVGGHLTGAYGILEALAVGAYVPFRLNQDALRGNAQSAGLGDMSLWAKGRLLTEQGGPFSLALVGALKFPSGKAEAFMGDDAWTGQLTAAFGRHVGPVALLGNLGYKVRSQSVEYVNLDFRDEILYGIGAGIPENTRFYSLEFFGTTPAADVFASAESPLEVLLSMHQRFAGPFRAEFGLGRGLTNGYGSPAFRAFAGVRWTPEMQPARVVDTDTDGDGLADAVDRCPAEAEDRDGYADDDGCPELDNDADGLADTSDECPLEAEDQDGFQDGDGCPDERFLSANEFLVIDREKKPIAGAVVEVLEAGKAVTTGTTDARGTFRVRLATGTYVLRASAPEHGEAQHAIVLAKPAHRWQVPLLAKAVEGFLSVTVRDAEGKLLDAHVVIRPENLKLAVSGKQPLAEATLKPGRYRVVAVAEGYETAATEVSIRAGRQVSAGMVLARIPPKVEAKAPVRVEMTREKIVIRDQVHFASGKATIKFDSYPLLDEIANVIRENPQVAKVRIEGHTDNVGRSAVNRKLSEKRAMAVRDYLVAKGIDGRRLEYVGLGDVQPIAPNDTAEGRATNRRVEFVITENQVAAQ